MGAIAQVLEKDVQRQMCSIVDHKKAWPSDRQAATGAASEDGVAPP